MKRLHPEPFSKYLLGSFFVALFAMIGILPLIILLIVGSKELDQLPNNEAFIYNMIPFVFGLIGFLLVVRYLHKRKFKTIITHRSSIDYSRIFFSFGVYGALALASFILSYYAYPEFTFQWNFKPEPFFILLLASIVLIPIQAGLEELIFRGYLMQGLENLSKNRWLPLMMTSLSFGLMHSFNLEISSFGLAIIGVYIIFGLVAGVCTQMDRGSELSIGFHIAHNLVTCLLVTADWTSIQTDALFWTEQIPSVWVIYRDIILIMPVFILIMAIRYKWNNWKFNLFGRFEAN